MNASLFTISFGAFSFAIAIVLSIGEMGQLPAAFKGRTCRGVDWRRAFPDVTKQEIRTFLSAFAEAFAFKVDYRLKFGPNDSIYGVYRALYPKLGGIDALELETFACEIEKRYDVQLRDVWTETLTLGELFSRLQEKASPVSAIIGREYS